MYNFIDYWQVVVKHDQPRKYYLHQGERRLEKLLVGEAKDQLLMSV